MAAMIDLFAIDSIISAFFIIPLILLLTLLGWKLAGNRQNIGNSLPPGPPALPIIGNLHQLSTRHPHLSLHRLAQKYGPIIHLRLGQVPTVIISSAELAKQAIRDHDLTLSYRPTTYAAKHLVYGGSADITFSPYGAYWRRARKLFTLELFSSKKVQLFEPVRREEVARLVRRVSSCYPQLVNLTEKLVLYSNDVICKSAFGRIFSESEADQYHKHGFQSMLVESQYLLGGFGIGDLFPSLEWINLVTGMKSRLARAFKRFDTFFDELIEERHLVSNQELGNSDILETLLQSHKNENSDLGLSMDNIKALIMDIFIAGTDTAAVALDWGMTELVMNPRVLKKAQKEIREVMGGREWVSDSDIANMDYLKAVVKEVFRLHPPTPVLLPRESIEEIELAGYKIPAKTRFFFNAFAIGRDPASYTDSEEFKPERFVGISVDYKGQDFELIPFGIGRRICPAILFGEASVLLGFAQLLHSFDWELPGGVEAQDLDMRVVFGMSMRRKEHLTVVAKPHFT